MTMLLKRVGEEFRANTTVPGRQLYQKVAPLSSGGFAMAWIAESGDGDGYAIHAQRFNADGGKVSGQIQVNTVVIRNQLEPSIAGLPSGGFVVTWTDESNVGSSDIRGRVFDSSGFALAPDFLINTTTAYHQGASNVFALPGGGFVVSWVDHGQTSSLETAYNVRAQIFDSSGAKVGQEFLVNPALAGVQTLPQGVALGSGGFVILWSDVTNGEVDVRAQLFDSAGGRIGGEFQVPANAAGEQGNADVAALPNGGFVVSWQGADPGTTTYFARAQMFDSAGARVGPEVSASNSDNRVSTVNVTGLASGGFLVSWEDHQNSTPTTRAQLFDSEGYRLGSQFQVNLAAKTGGYSDLATLSSGRLVATWNYGSYDVNGQVFRAPLIGTPLADALAGGAEDDGIAGLASDDILSGGSGKDTLDGGAGDDRLTGGAGSDWLAGGIGTDTADYSLESGGGGVTVNLSGGPVWVSNVLALQPGQARDSHLNVDTLEGIENVTTGAGVDVVHGDAAANRIETGGGGDLLFGGAGADILIGGDGGDQYYIQASDSSAFEDVIVEHAGGGIDQVRTTFPSFTLAGLPEVEWLLGLADIAFTLTGNDRDNYLQGNTRADTLEGGLGDDELVGLGGDDIMRGGLGDDIYRVEDIGDVVEENEGEGTDTVWTTLATYSLLGTQIENLAAFSDIAHDFRGNEAGNVIFGGNANNFLRLHDGGDDEAYGGEGDDVFLFGGTFTAGDQVYGGDGRDQIAIQGDYAGAEALTLGSNVEGIENLAILPGDDTRFGDPGTNFYSYEITAQDAALAAGVQLVVDANRLRPRENLTFNGSAESDGSFFIYGGNGVDMLTGGARNDVFIFGHQGQWGTGDIVTGGAGTDQLALRGNYTITFGANQLVGI
ncbi:MAG TPA: calcium-binding protein, partial [Allosphingosinicella sp.]